MKEINSLIRNVEFVHYRESCIIGKSGGVTLKVPSIGMVLQLANNFKLSVVPKITILSKSGSDTALSCNKKLRPFIATVFGEKVNSSKVFGSFISLRNLWRFATRRVKLRVVGSIGAIRMFIDASDINSRGILLETVALFYNLLISFDFSNNLASGRCECGLLSFTSEPFLIINRPLQCDG